MTKDERYIIDRVKAGRFNYDGTGSYVIQTGKFFVWVANGVGSFRYGRSHDATYRHGWRSNKGRNFGMRAQWSMLFAYRKAIRKYNIRTLEYADIRNFRRRLAKPQATQTPRGYRNA